MFDLDVVQRKRVDLFWTEFSEKGILLDDIFLSDQIASRLGHQKIALDSFSVDRVLTTIPFCEEVFVHVCPACISKKNFVVFKGLVDSGLITPVFTSSYSQYASEVIEVVATKPHISVYEYSLYKTAVLSAKSEGALCDHCVDIRISDLNKLVHRKRNAPVFREHLDTIVRNIYPFLAPDNDILDEVESCFKELDIERCQRIVDTSWGIRSIRNAQTFDAPVILTDERIENFSNYAVPELAELGRIGFQLREFISHGLGLKIPTNMPIQDYIALIKDIRPHMQSINSKMIECGDGGDEKSLRAIFNQVGDVNREVDRILRSKRYLFLEAVTSLLSNNKALLASSLVAAGLGLGGSVLGCGATATAGVAIDYLKKKGKLPKNNSMANLGSAIHRDLEPTLKKVVAAYVGSTVVPLQVIALRKKIGGSKS